MAVEPAQAVVAEGGQSEVAKGRCKSGPAFSVDKWGTFDENAHSFRETRSASV